MAIQAITAYYKGEGGEQEDQMIFEEVIAALRAKDLSFEAPELAEFEEHPGEPASSAIAPASHGNFIQIAAVELTDPVLRRQLDGMWCGEVILYIDDLAVDQRRHESDYLRQKRERRERAAADYLQDHGRRLSIVAGLLRRAIADGDNQAARDALSELVNQGSELQRAIERNS